MEKCLRFEFDICFRDCYHKIMNITDICLKKQNNILKPILEELETINANLKKLLLIIPEETLKEYKNPTQIKSSYLKAIKSFPPIEK